MSKSERHNRTVAQRKQARRERMVVIFGIVGLMVLAKVLYES